jgi:glycolate oxidase iron-sulfur subunit
MPEMPPAATDPGLLALADQCVMCGLCQPHCPTYRLDRHEAESPRGRIAMARKLAIGTLQPAPATLAHLDHCLSCLSCQKVCPSQVRYDDILIRTRALLAPMRPDRDLARRWLTRPATLRNLARLGAAFGAGHWLPRLARLLPKDSPWRRIGIEMPSLPARLPAVRNTPALRETRGSVTLFPGCVASVFDRDTLAAGRRLLEALGYRVIEPAQSVCCGALALHAGDTDAATENAKSTRAALQSSETTTVLVSASGCLGSLRDHTMAGSDLRIEDIGVFLARDPEFNSLRFRPLASRAAFHLPCTQVNVGSGGGPVRTLLARIPGLEILALPEQPRCCGAAGSYFLEYPDRADRLRTEKLDQVTVQAPDLLLTTNIGCRIFLGNGLRQRDSALPVMHPLALLARQLETSFS